MAIVYTDTLVTDSVVLARWHADNAYDYGRELVQSNFSLSEWFEYTIARLINEIERIVSPSDNNEGIWVIVGIAIVAAIVLFFVLKHPTLFGRKDKKQPLDYQIVEDNIYGIDFATQIACAMERADYQAAVRLIYLQTLRHLSDAGRIKWRKSKPPMQYARDVDLSEMRQLVLLFVRIRYGGYTCQQEDVQEAQRLQQAICQPLNKEGGEP